MPQKRYKPEEIIHKLRAAEVGLTKEHTMGQICRKPGNYRTELLSMA